MAVGVLCVGGKIIAILDRRPWYVLFYSQPASRSFVRRKFDYSPLQYATTLNALKYYGSYWRRNASFSMKRLVFCQENAAAIRFRAIDFHAALFNEIFPSGPVQSLKIEKNSCFCNLDDPSYV